MKHVRLLFCLLALSMSFTVMAQRQTPLEVADQAYENYAFYQAIDLYKKAYSKTKKTADKKRILYRIGQSYYQINDNSNAENWLKKAVKAGVPEPKAQYLLADAIRRQGRFDEAMVEFKKYVSDNPSDPSGKTAVKSCQLATEWKDKPTRYFVEPEPLLNSKQDDFSPTYGDKKHSSLVFTSTREGSTGNSIDPNTGGNFSGLWVSTRDKKGKWSVPTPLPETVNTIETNEGSAGMDAKFSYVYFTRCAMKKNQALGCDIYRAKKAGKSWGQAEIVDIKKPDSSVVGHPAIAFKDYLFFASDMPGGQGGKDIWYVKYEKKGKKWSDPVNLGKEVNTSGDEMFPFVRKDGNLYFASNGHPGMGGLDIFKATRDGKNMKWGKVENMQSPINSEGDDFGIHFDGLNERGFFSTDRSGGRGEGDIWTFRIPPLKFIIDGVVTDLESNQPIQGVTIKLIGTDGSSVELVSDELGYYEFDAKQGSNDRYVLENTSYTMEVSKEKYLRGKGQETTVGVEKSTRFKHDFKLQPITEKAIEFPEVRYDLGKWDLQVNDQVNSKDSLNYLYQTLIDNPNIVIELMAHTDSRGRDASNQKLSQKRAQSCVDYLIGKGIEQGRLQAKGYGESTPYTSKQNVVYNDEFINSLPTKEEKEAAHQKNRRTEFRILRDDFVPKPKEEAPVDGAKSEEKAE